MIRRRRLPLLPQLCAILLGVLWLSGCATATREGQAPPDFAQAVQLNVAMGIEYMEQGNLSRAQTKIDRALDIAPQDPSALQAQALLYQRQGESDLARRFFEQALAAAPDFTRARNNYAAFLYAEGHIEASCAQLERATQDLKYDNRAQLYTNLGLCQRELGNIEAARDSLVRAQAIDPRNARSYLTLAQIHHAQGNDAAAWDQLQAFIRLAGITPASRQLAQQIAQARGGTPSAALDARQREASQVAP